MLVFITQNRLHILEYIRKIRRKYLHAHENWLEESCCIPNMSKNSVLGSPLHIKKDSTFLALNTLAGFLRIKHESRPLSVPKKQRRLCMKSLRIDWYPYRFPFFGWIVPFKKSLTTFKKILI